MIVNVIVEELRALVGKKLAKSEIADTLFLLKSETETIDEETIAVEVNPDRQDMLSVEGIARALRAFLGIAPGPVRLPVRKSGKHIEVMKGLEKVRPYIACGVAKDVETSGELIKEYMHLQELLTDTHGRNRRKASIGLYVYDELKFPVTYRLERPERIRFVPLGHDTEMDGPTILEKHDKGVLYGPIIAPFKRWPLLQDATGRVLSLPPIINSNDLGRVTQDTHDIFVEVTGTHLPTVEQALNIMMASLAERHGRLESLTIKYPNGEAHETPDLSMRKTTIETADASRLTGLQLSDSETVRCLGRMCYGARVVRPGKIEVQIPPYRTDILHEVDVFEDIAIGYGYDKILPTFPSTMTSGGLLPSTRLKNKVRDLMVGTKYQEVMSYVMSSPDTLIEKMNRDEPVVTTGNPKSREFSVMRNSLLPILVEFIGKNQHADYPQKVFEVGDTVIPDLSAETRCSQLPTVCGVIADSKVNLTDMMGELAFVLCNLGLEGRFTFAERNDSSFIEGRCGTVLVNGEDVGYFGELDPVVLTNFGITRPLAAFEVRFPRSGVW